MRHDSFNESTEMYLKTVSELAVGDTPVPISALAERLGVSAVSATEMVHRLQEHGLVVHQAYKGVCLTADGRRQAAGVVRSHRLWECFLADRLGLPWEAVHDLACRLEHATDPQVTEALDAYLGRPATCPHGNPIPAADGATMAAPDCPLAELRPDQPAIITRVYPESPALLSYLAELGLTTGARVTLREIAPFQGPLALSVGADVRHVGQQAVAPVYARPIEEEPA
jgi:DtxR family Mn-dependent transcriptional regulator